MGKRKALNVVLMAGVVFGAVAEGWASPRAKRAEQASQRWHAWRRAQKRFPIAVWSYFYRFEGTKAEYQRYADANLTMVTAPQSQYANAVAAGLNVLLGGRGQLHGNREKLLAAISFPTPTDRDVIGYQMIDEPQPDSFDSAAEAVGVIYEKDQRGAIPIIDMLPNWAWQRNNNRVLRFGYHYARFIEKYLDTVHPPVLLNCHYPPLADGSDRVEYYANLELFRDCALQRDIGLMAFVIATEYTGVNRPPSDSDLRWQVYSALAYGAQGLWYWNWRIKPDSKRGFTEGLVTYETDQPTREYHLVKAINSEVLAIGEVLLKLRSLAVFHTGKDIPDGTRRFPNRGDSGYSSIERFEGDRFIIGEFRNADDPTDEDSYVMVVNKRHGLDLSCDDPSVVATCRFRISPHLKYAYAYDRHTGKPTALTADEKTGTYSLTLGGGQGVLLRFSRRAVRKSAAPASGGRVSMQAVYAGKPITVDGILDERVWRHAKSYPMYVPAERSSSAVQPAESGLVRLAWDERYLYVGAKFEDSDVVALGETDDLPHYKLGDVCEIFLKPVDQPWYWELWATPRGKKTAVFWSRRGQRGAKRKLTLRSAARVSGSVNDSTDTDEGWTCETAIPIAELGAADRWLVLVARQNYTGAVDPEHRELSATSRLSQSNFHLYEEYAVLDLAKTK